MSRPTDKQLALIQSMEQLLDVSFHGTSCAEASQFIACHVKRYQEELAFVFDIVHNENNY